MNNKSSRVLIVDDMPINRMVLSSLLAAQGVMSDQAESGAECIELCEEKDYDLVLLDHRMPDLDGVDTLVRLKEIFKSREKEIPIVCHTTSEGKQNINLYKAAGFADVLIKPIEPKELMEVIMTYLPDVVPARDLFTDFTQGVRDDLAKPCAEEEDNRLEIEKLPMWLKLVPHIDLVLGVTNCGLAEDYLDALYIFYSSIEEKSEDIEKFFEEEDWTMYALRIHSLKSIARLIGAKKLGEAAAVLEAASREGNIDIVRRETPMLLDSYKEFSRFLSAFDREEEKQRRVSEDTVQTQNVPKAPDVSHCILFIRSGEGIVKRGIETNLTAAGFDVISIPDEPDQIIAHRKEADIVIYYLGLSDNSCTKIMMSLLGEICQDDNKILCLIGDAADLENAECMNGFYRVSRTYPRPVDLEAFLSDMKYYAELEAEYHRRKTVFVVDDDADYLPIIKHWLSEEYNVSCFGSGEEVLNGLHAVTPDLILLDYEMPKIDGRELMRRIRTTFPDSKIPMIFLTGKNDKEHVFNILEFKPDGYLLKTSQKETILDVVQRFFAESMFRLTI